MSAHKKRGQVKTSPFESARPAFEIRPVRGGDAPRDIAHLLIIAGRLAAVIVPRRMPRKKLDTVFAVCPESWAARPGLAARWQCWAVICDADIADWLKAFPVSPVAAGSAWARTFQTAIELL